LLAFDAESGLPRKIALRWIPSDDEMVSGYHLSRSKAGGEFKRIAELAGRENCAYVDEGDIDKGFFGGGELVRLADGGDYAYRVTAFNPAGAESEIASETEARTKEIPPTPATPTARSGLPGRISLEWERPAGDDIGGFVVMGGFSENTLGDIGRTSETNFEETGLQAGQKRCYAIRVVDRDGLESLPGAAVSATTKPLPEAPGGLSVARAASGWTLSWQAPPQEDVVKYRIWEKRFLGKSELKVVETSSVELSDAEVGKKTVLMIQAIDADGLESGLSEGIEIRAEQ
jgi:fibronectin type 3 domain-containing protein